jgi:hypothetical protein
MIHSAVDIVDDIVDEIIVEDVVGRRRGVAFEEEEERNADGVRRLRLLTACSSLSFVLTATTIAFLLLLRLLIPLRRIEDIDDGREEEKACTASVVNGNDDDDDAKSTIIAAAEVDEQLCLFFIATIQEPTGTREVGDFNTDDSGCRSK